MGLYNSGGTCHGQTTMSDQVGDLGVRGSWTRLQRWFSERGHSQRGNRSCEVSHDKGDDKRRLHKSSVTWNRARH